MQIILLLAFKIGAALSELKKIYSSITIIEFHAELEHTTVFDGISSDKLFAKCSRCVYKQKRTKFHK